MIPPWIQFRRYQNSRSRSPARVTSSVCSPPVQGEDARRIAISIAGGVPGASERGHRSVVEHRARVAVRWCRSAVAVVNAFWLCQPQNIGRWTTPSRSSCDRYRLVKANVPPSTNTERATAARATRRRQMKALAVADMKPSAGPGTLPAPGVAARSNRWLDESLRSGPPQCSTGFPALVHARLWAWKSHRWACPASVTVIW